MPQMSPMNWFFLFMYFNVAVYLTFIKVHFLSSGVMMTKGAIKVKNVAGMMFLI